MEDKKPIKKRPAKRIKPKAQIKPLEDTSQDLSIEDTKKPIQGLGDAVKAVTSLLGIEQCEPCIERQEKMNKMFPFTKKANPIPEEDYEFILAIKNTILQEDRKRFEQLVRDTFKVKFIPCNCPSKYRTALENLKTQISYQEKIKPNAQDL